MNHYKLFAKLMVSLLAMFALNSCVKDTLKTTYTYYKPVYKSKSAVFQDIKSSTPVVLQQTGKLFKYGDYIFVNELNKGVHIIDNSNPSAPVNKYFIAIPGSVDIAVKDNTLYADIYTDLVAIDISNPTAAVLKKVMYHIFPERQYQNGFVPDSTQYIVDWKKHETTNKEDLLSNGNASIDGTFLDMVRQTAFNSASTKSAGISGSMARFTIKDNYLYTVGQTDLSSINIAETNNPILENKVGVGWQIETIYPLKNHLFIGGQTGMFIYNINNPATPVFTGGFSHACFNDPVIADDKYAYVTLRALGTANTCRGAVAAQRNELDIVDITNLSAPRLVKIYDMAEPKGLSKDGNHLFICDGKGGLKVYDATDVLNLKLLRVIANINPFDVIVENDLAIVVANEGIFQYDYSNINNIKLLSRIVLGNK